VSDKLIVQCDMCGNWLREDECVYIDKYTLQASTGDNSVPFCVPCCPEEIDTEADSIKQAKQRRLAR